MQWVTALDLERWGASIASRQAVAKLVGDLVNATVSSITKFRFPDGESSELPGPDGYLECEGAPPRVPAGPSYWEFGATGDVLDKANNDYKDRTAEVPEAERQRSTFVFVTPRQWKHPRMHLQRWVRERRAENLWADVAALDGADLERWLEDAPPVAARFARFVLSKPELRGARSLDEYWEWYASRFEFTPPLAEEVLLCGRAEQARDVLAALAGPRGTVRFAADAHEEVVAFAVAAARKAEPAAARRRLMARTLVVDTADAAHGLALRRGYAFIARGDAVGDAGMLAAAGPVLVPTGNATPGPRPAERLLARPAAHEFAEALRPMVADHAAAHRLARECGRSVTILGRRRPAAGVEPPPWAAHAATLLPALLAGGWDGSSPADQAVLSALAGGVPYTEFDALLRALPAFEDPPLDREGAVWKARAPVDLFVNLARHLAPLHLERLRGACLVVLGEADAALDADDDAPFAPGDAQRFRHSRWLRDGLATSLLMVSALHEEAGFGAHEHPQSYVDEVVRAVPGLAADHRMMAALRDQLPLLAEAAPVPFLEALGSLLEGGGGRLRPLFRDVDPLFAHHHHTGLLWALEVLAWDPALLGRAARALAALAQIDPGGRIVNRPASALVEILRPWHPSTNATLDQRVAVLDDVLRAEPAVGWPLLSALLPENHGVATPTVSPRFREAGSSGRERLTWGIVRRGYEAVISRALDAAGPHPDRWGHVAERLEAFAPPQRAAAVMRLEAAMAGMDEAARTAVWERVDAVARRHRSFSDAAWALPAAELERLEALAARSAPTDPVAAAAWTFDRWHPDLPADPRTFTEVLDDRRTAAARGVVAAEGPDGLLRLAGRVRLPHAVARAAARVLEPADAEALLWKAVEQDSGPGTAFATPLSAELRALDPLWAERLRGKAASGAPPSTVAALLSAWPDVPATWDFAEACGVADEYWRVKGAWALDDVPPDARERAARHYVAARRAADALGALRKRLAGLPGALALGLLDAAIDEVAGEGERGPHDLRPHFVAEAFAELRRHPGVPRGALAGLELRCLPLLRGTDEPLALHEAMAEDPEVFVTLLKAVFVAEGEPRAEPSEQARRMAAAAYRALDSFDAVPGQRGSEVEGAALRRWVSEVMRLGAEAGRAAISADYAGRVVAHVVPDPSDGAWPHRAARDLIEAAASDHLETGMAVERFNMRGAYTKSLHEGGVQEREIAARYAAWASACAAWPRTAGLLRGIADDYGRQARAEDIRARQDLMRD